MTSPHNAVPPSTLHSLLTVARANLAAELSEAATPGQHLDRIVQLAQQLVPGTEHAAVSALDDQIVQTLAATSSIPASIDQAQSSLGDGPIFQVQATTHRPVRIDDPATDTRWPAYAAQLRQFGLASVVVCELPMTHGTLSVLSVYASRRHAYRNAGELIVPVFADRAAIALAHAQQLTHLHRAIDSRQLIGEAVGILIERYRISSDEAFQRLVTASQRRHVKLRELAERLRETGEEPENVTI